MAVLMVKGMSGSFCFQAPSDTTAVARLRHGNFSDPPALTRFALRDPRFRAVVRTRVKHVSWAAPTYSKIVDSEHTMDFSEDWFRTHSLTFCEEWRQSWKIVEHYVKPYYKMILLRRHS